MLVLISIPLLISIVPETSTHSLVFTLALLALFPDAQETMYQETLEVFPDSQWGKDDVTVGNITIAIFLVEFTPLFLVI